MPFGQKPVPAKPGNAPFASVSNPTVQHAVPTSGSVGGGSRPVVSPPMSGSGSSGVRETAPPMSGSVPPMGGHGNHPYGEQAPKGPMAPAPDTTGTGK